MKLTQRSLIWLGIVFIIFGLIACQTPFRPAQYSVKRVSDGDTLTVTDTKGTDIKVRFACIDAPEVPHSAKERASKIAAVRDQFKWGVQAQNRVKQLINQAGDRVNLIVTDSDRYGRKISEVRLSDGTFVQEVLAREGLALLYRPYLKNCPSAAIVEQAESVAKQQRQGVWSDAKFLEPWAYRHRNK